MAPIAVGRCSPPCCQWCHHRLNTAKDARYACILAEKSIKTKPFWCPGSDFLRQRRRRRWFISEIQWVIRRESAIITSRGFNFEDIWWRNGQMVIKNAIWYFGDSIIVWNLISQPWGIHEMMRYDWFGWSRAAGTKPYLNIACVLLKYLCLSP